MAKSVANVNKSMEEDHLRFENVRLKSLLAWTAPKDKKTLPNLLAAAGFYYTGKDDKMKCFDCHVEISGWCNREDPFEEHKRFSSKCKMVCNKPCGNIPLDGNPTVCPLVPKHSEICQLDASKFSQDELDEIIEVYFEKLDLVLSVTRGDLIGAKFPHFCTFESRLETFKKYPERWSQSGEDLAAAGWMCAYNDDKTLCFYCAGGAMYWRKNDDPIQEHVKYYPKCKFITRLVEKRKLDQGTAGKAQEKSTEE